MQKMNTLIIVGIFMIISGFVLILAGTILETVTGGGEGKGENNIYGGAVIFIGPIPLCFDFIFGAGR